MADTARMALPEELGKLMEREHADVLRESVELVLRQIMEAEVAALAGAGRYEHTDERIAVRNGYRPRGFDTRVGSIELQIPRLRTGSYFPSFLSPRRRSEQALVSVVQEAYINGVSTRKVERLVEQLGVAGMNKDQVSRLCQGLDEQVRIFRERPLEGRYPSVWLDAKTERVREPGGVRQKCLVIAYAVHETGRREVIGLDVGECESEAFWREFLRGLRSRGLSGVKLVVSDAHEGLRQAIAKVLGAPWQRCTVHFLRDMLGHVTRAQQPLVSGAIRGIFTATSHAEARARLGQVVEQLRPTRPRSRPCWRTPRPTCWPSTRFRPSTGPSCAAPTPWSGPDREIGRRSDVVGIFPNDAALLRLATSLLIEQNDEWLVGRRYLSAASMGPLLEERPHRENDEEVLELQPA
jgi:putative transposase